MGDLTKMTKNERRYLSRRACGLCDMPMDRDSCGSIYGPPCSEQVRSDRRARCLSEYKPRLVPASKGSSNE